MFAAARLYLFAPLALLLLPLSGTAQTGYSIVPGNPGDEWYNIPGTDINIYEHSGDVRYRNNDGVWEIKAWTDNTYFEVDEDEGDPVVINVNEGNCTVEYDGNGVTINVGNDGDGANITLDSDGAEVYINANDTSSTLVGQSSDNRGHESASSTGNEHTDDGSGSNNKWQKGSDPEVDW